MKATNTVLYAVENGARRPLLSCDVDDKSAPFKFVATCGETLRVCSQRGVPHPEFVLMRETREADEGRIIKSSTFEILDLQSGKAVGESFDEIDAAFASLKGA